MPSSLSSRTATQVWNSGQVAIASAMDTSGSTGGPPNRAAYQVCTAAWFLASHGRSGRAAPSVSVARSSRSRVRSSGSKNGTSMSRTAAGSKPSP